MLPAVKPSRSAELQAQDEAPAGPSGMSPASISLIQRSTLKPQKFVAEAVTEAPQEVGRKSVLSWLGRFQAEQGLRQEERAIARMIAVAAEKVLAKQTSAAVVLQSVYRGYVARTAYNKTRASIITAQAIVRQYIARTQYAEMVVAKATKEAADLMEKRVAAAAQPPQPQPRSRPRPQPQPRPRSQPRPQPRPRPRQLAASKVNNEIASEAVTDGVLNANIDELAAVEAAEAAGVEPEPEPAAGVPLLEGADMPVATLVEDLFDNQRTIVRIKIDGIDFRQNFKVARKMNKSKETVGYVLNGYHLRLSDGNSSLIFRYQFRKEVCNSASSMTDIDDHKERARLKSLAKAIMTPFSLLGN